VTQRAHTRIGARRSLSFVAAFGPLIETAWLRAHLNDPDLVVVDCRYVLGNPGAGKPLWLEGHIPGAAFLDVDRDLAGEPGERGRHPLPEPADFQAAARRAGIESASRVVAYDEAGEGGAARLWWLLRHFGHDDAAVLNGGLAAWREEGGPLEAGEQEGRPLTNQPFTAKQRPSDTVTAEELSATNPRLLDARSPERYRGETEPIDPVAGHIPGAANVYFAEIAPKGRFLREEELRERLGEEPFVAYCGSGITACTLVLAGELAGVEGRLYPGSWSEWCRR
jgi:thiosulfate/3-mercaptopyruvate sulfurtransferase